MPYKLDKLVIAVGTLLSASVISSAGRADYIANGSFEQVQIGSPYYSTNPADVPGWTRGGASGDGPLLWAVGYHDAGGTITTAADGRQFVTLGGGYFDDASATWSTSITGLTVGKSYLLTFNIANENNFNTSPPPEGPPGPQTVSVQIATNSLGSFTAPADSTYPYWGNWLQENVLFTAGASIELLQFSTTTNFDVGLDNVQVNAVPSPIAGTGIPGLIAACVGLLTLWRPRQKFS